MKEGFYYLASPLKGTPEEEAYRVELSLKLTIQFLTQSIYVFSPLIYTAKIAEILSFPTDEERRQVLMTYLLAFLKVSKGMILLTMEGWKKSWGVNQEIIFCQENQMPVYLMNPEEKVENFSRVLSTPLNLQQLSQLLEAA